MLFIHFCFFHWQFLLYITVHAWISLLYIHNDSLSRTVKSHTKQHVLLKRSLFFNDHYQGMSYFGKCDKAVKHLWQKLIWVEGKMKIWVLFSFFCLSCCWKYYTYSFFSFLFSLLFTYNPMYYLGDICLSSFTKLIWHTTTSLLANCVPRNYKY